MAKYTVSYCAGATGFGWRKEYNRLDEFEDFIDEVRHDYSAYASVWDESVQDFIFWKDCLELNPSIDKLSDIFRDRRTTTKRMKGV